MQLNKSLKALLLGYIRFRVHLHMVGLPTTPQQTVIMHYWTYNEAKRIYHANGLGRANWDYASYDGWRTWDWVKDAWAGIAWDQCGWREFAKQYKLQAIQQGINQQLRALMDAVPARTISLPPAPIRDPRAHALRRWRD